MGTELRLQKLKQGNEDFTNWLSRMIEPRVLIEVLDFSCDGLAYSVIAIEPSYERPEKFSGVYIHGEWMRNLAATTPGLPKERLELPRDRMKAVLPEADVVNYRPLIEDLKLPGRDDRHVLAAAIAGKASVIVTWNLKDFPRRDLRPYGITSKSPDDFLADLHIAFPEALLYDCSK
ncbi:PIN domain-containing protein [Rhizobium ruizarguesonis]|uniref:PIN domain-containing protein n=1 Tax=Rhizobium ruizarguesonis TaxID=2081791 RepID=UPI001FE19E05|nr:PIN domain-containing protein [Rhizobium ruizarguesonis]